MCWLWGNPPEAPPPPSSLPPDPAFLLPFIFLFPGKVSSIVTLLTTEISCPEPAQSGEIRIYQHHRLPYKVIFNPILMLLWLINQFTWFLKGYRNVDNQIACHWSSVKIGFRLHQFDSEFLSFWVWGLVHDYIWINYCLSISLPAWLFQCVWGVIEPVFIWVWIPKKEPTRVLASDSKWQREQEPHCCVV